MKILIVDDHALFRDGLSYVINELGETVNILEAANYEAALTHVAANPDLDLVLLDLNMPGKDGFTALNTLSQQFPALPVVILSASNLRSDMQRALDAGAMGYIPKDTPSAIMLSAIQLVLSGGIYIPQNMAIKPASQTAGLNASTLTPRQLDVLSMLVHGHSNKKIASELALAEATVKMHVTSILKNLGVDNRTQAALAAAKLGLVLNPN